ncbi:MAG: hypothetical protein HZB61_10210 [Nitrospirae bacterium]|nr:hypothetical protein [Nitrospirota bacterium]
MNETLKATLDMVRTISQASQVKTKRNFTDFLADKIVQASAEPSLLSAIERLSGLINAAPGEVYQPALAAFVKACSDGNAAAALRWLREYPRVAAMLTMLKAGDYEDTISTLELPEDAGESGTALPAGKHEIEISMTCLSPLAHGSDTKAGNATLFRRMHVLSTTGAVLSLPFYAGNALRGLIRDILADDLIKSLGLVPRRDKPPVALWFFHALYAGGALEENSEAAKKLKKELGGDGTVKAQGIHEFRDTLPGLSLLGCALGNRILCGRAKFADLRPSCKQWGNGEVDAAQLFEWLYLTRREDHEEHADHSGMIANTECLRAGTVLYGGIDLDVHANELERSALGRALKLLAERGYIGAENRRGMGRVSVNIENAPTPEPYEKYLSEQKNNIAEYLEKLGAIQCTLLS